MVVAQEARAARIGVAVLERGGNAVDAAVATGFAMAVTYPRAGNIGGGGYMVIHLAERQRGLQSSPSTIARPRRRRRPATMFLDEKGNADPRKSRDSALAIGVPGTVAGLALAHQRYGSGRLTLARTDGAGDRAGARRVPGRGRCRRTRCRARARGWGAGRRRPRSSCGPTARCSAPATCWCSATSPTRWRRSRNTGRARSTTARSPTSSPPPCRRPAAS